MKKYLPIVLMLIMAAGIFAGCSSEGNGNSGVDVDLKCVESSATALVGSFANNSGKDVNAKVTVVWYDEDNNQIGESVSEIPYLMQDDVVFDIFDLGEPYDHYDYMVETGEPSDKAIAFYENLTVEGDMDADGSISYKVGGGNGETYETDVVLEYLDEEDNVIDYNLKTIKASGIATGSFPATKASGCVGYRMNLIPKDMM
ncbi:MAG: FxLYD domain-containing protein [Clostridiales bacterium]|nr:FxLYD domain-containing protein [Candidatus Crickella caballi]